MAGGLLLALGAAGRAQTPVSVVPTTLPRGFTLQRPDSSYAISHSVPVADQPFFYALRVDTRKRPNHSWNIQLNARTTAAVRAGDRLHASFWLRRIRPADGEAYVTFVFEKAAPNWDKSVVRTFAVDTDEWRQFNVAFEASSSHAPGDAQINIPLGYAPQTIEIAAVTVTNYFRTVTLEDLPDDQTYGGRDPDAPWRAEAAARIEQLRKADLTVRVVDADGQPVPNAAVAVHMQRHAFGFGSAVKAHWVLGTGSDASRYRNVVTQWFNRVVIENDLKWPQYEQDRQRARNVVAWFNARDIPVRGHNLIWPSWRFMPDDVEGLAGQPAALRKRINDHIDEEAADFAGRLQDWDVINEPYTEHDVQDILGDAEMVKWFQRAKASDPHARLFLNDYGNLEGVGLGTPHQEGTWRIIADLIAAGAPVEGVGLQGHFGSYLSSPMQCLAVFDRFAELGRPLLVTEFDVNTGDEALQAEYTRDFLTAAFSHPAVDGVLAWGFWAGSHWRPEAAMFRRDWTLKPNGVTWSNLVFKTWWTDASLATDAEGAARVRAFKGRHQVHAALGSVTAEQTIELTDEGEVTLTLPLRRVALSARVAGDQLVLTWPATSAEPETLEGTAALAEGAWTPVAGTPERVGDDWQVIEPLADARRFYRLSPP